MMSVIVEAGDSPVILGQPHGGTFVPPELLLRLNQHGKGLGDTDWHITRLYDGLLPGATTVKAEFHRYVIDANRDPGGNSLYPGQNTTSLCPTTDFDGEAIWIDGQQPSGDEIEERRQKYHAPYHEALATEIERVKAIHGYAILYDCHSIRSNIPFLFENTLPVFNIGTNDGKTCSGEIEKTVIDVCANAIGLKHVVNGRFKGGWTTRHYGQPEQSVHAIQMELAQRAYMDEQTPWGYRADLAENLRPHLSDMLSRLSALKL
ncbi:MAG: N-formylglutamate deformylase [Hyphomicrobiales bacterium]|nr:MAG: N-formylglutamate deformylase [Hyphomicrobiales bacterium]